MSVLTNNKDFGLVMAIWLAHDEYTNGSDEFPGENVISATTLLKPTRQIILSSRLTPGESTPDVSDYIAARFGHAIHDSVEHALTTGIEESLKKLGYPPGMIKKIKINPTEVQDGDIPIYLEQRFFRRLELDGRNSVIISGKVDQLVNGELNDIKTTSAYTFKSGSKEEDYCRQGSIYRWLDPVKVTSDIIRIQHVFTDWQRMQAKIDPAYPQERITEKKIQLMPLAETEQFIRAKILEIARYQDADEADLPYCTDKDLWKTDPVWKFYSDPKKAAEGGRATKNFPDAASAYAHASKAGKGVVVEVPGKVKACSFCAVFHKCTQKDLYEHD